MNGGPLNKPLGDSMSLQVTLTELQTVGPLSDRLEPLPPFRMLGASISRSWSHIPNTAKVVYTSNGGFQKLGALFRNPHNKHHILGLMLGFPMYGNRQIYLKMTFVAFRGQSCRQQ